MKWLNNREEFQSTYKIVPAYFLDESVILEIHPHMQDFNWQSMQLAPNP
jgi:hypothetical protein